MKSEYSSNIWKISMIQSLSYDYLLWWIYVIYMISKGLSLSEVSIVISAWFAFATLWQIPWWMFADNLGYKTSIVCWSVLTLIWISFFAFSTDFIWFFVWYSIYWFGSALITGADEALVYEWLKQDRQEKDFKKIIWKIHFIINIYAMVASIAWWFLYSYFLPITPFVVQIWLSIIGLLAAITIKPVPQKTIQLNVINQIKESFSYAIGTKSFSKVFIFSAIIWSVSISLFQYLQPFYKSLEIDEKFFWIIAAITFLFRWLGSLYANKLWKLFSIDHYLVLHATVFSLFLIIMQRLANIPILCVIILALFFLRCLYEPTIWTFINEKVSGEMRATMLSTNSQIRYLVSSLTLLWIWYIADKYSLNTGFFWLSILSMVFLIIYVLSLRKVKIE